MRLPVVRVVVIGSTAIILFAAMLNVAELLLARELGARAGGLRDYERRYLFGALAVAAGLLGFAASPFYAVALPAFLVLGLGNGLVVVHERLIFQATVPERL